MMIRNAGSKIIFAPRAPERNLLCLGRWILFFGPLPALSTCSCDVKTVQLRHGASKSSLESKLKGLDDTQATALMVWASAFWVSRNCSAENMDEYIRAY